MRYPKRLAESPRSTVTHTAFCGYDHRLSCPENAFYEMENLSAAAYPQLCPSRTHQKAVAVSDSGGIIAKEALCYVNGQDLVINGYAVPVGLTPGEKQLVSMGAWVIILPDKKRVNTVTYQVENLENHFAAQGTVTFTPCALTGAPYDTVVGSEPPQDTAKLWVDTAARAQALKLYNTATAQWETLATAYVRIAAAGIGTGFAVHQGVTLSGIESRQLQALGGEHALLAVSDDFVVVQGLCPGAFSQSGGLEVRRTMPDMDFVVEHQNRLWGCKYGIVGGVHVNEIYASALGDPGSWRSFLGTAADSIVISCGSDGPFTAAAVLDAPLFFKEEGLHRIYGGSYPFGVHFTACRGVQKGCSKTLQRLGEQLYYLSPGGVMVYDGGEPRCISQCLGPLSGPAVAGVSRACYYLSMDNGPLLAYTPERHLWHKLAGLNAREFALVGEQLYARCDSGIWAVEAGEAAGFSAVTGIIGAGSPGSWYLTGLQLRLQLAPGAHLRIGASYDDGPVVQLASLQGRGVRCFSLPLRLHRCGHLRLVFRGQGAFHLLSLRKTMEKGSDTP